jgi:phage I-like protein
LIDAIEQTLPGSRLLAFDVNTPPLGGDDPTSNTRRHRLLITGEWAGHWQGGFAVTESDLVHISTNAKARQTQILVDYEHKSVFSFFASAGDTKAAGWLDPQSLAIVETDTGHALDGTIRWNRAAGDAIRENEFRYLSPTIQWKTADRQSGVDTGTSLHSVALTNTPFLEELPEVRLNSIAARLGAPALEDEAMDPKQLAALAALLDLSADATADQVIAAARALVDEAKQFDRLYDVLELAHDVQPTEIISTVTTMKAQQIDPDELAKLRAQGAEAGKALAAAAVKKAADAGKIVASNREWAEALAAKDLGAFTEWADAAPKAFDTEVKVPPATVATFTGDDDEEPEGDQLKALVAKAGKYCRSEAKKAGVKLETYVQVNAAELIESGRLTQ